MTIAKGHSTLTPCVPSHRAPATRQDAGMQRDRYGQVLLRKLCRCILWWFASACPVSRGLVEEPRPFHSTFEFMFLPPRAPPPTTSSSIHKRNRVQTLPRHKASLIGTNSSWHGPFARRARSLLSFTKFLLQTQDILFLKSICNVIEFS